MVDRWKYAKEQKLRREKPENGKLSDIVRAESMRLISRQKSVERLARARS